MSIGAIGDSLEIHAKGYGLYSAYVGEQNRSY